MSWVTYYLGIFQNTLDLQETMNFTSGEAIWVPGLGGRLPSTLDFSGLLLVCLFFYLLLFQIKISFNNNTR